MAQMRNKRHGERATDTIITVFSAITLSACCNSGLSIAGSETPIAVDISQISSNIALQSALTAVTALLSLILLITYANSLFSTKTAALEQSLESIKKQSQKIIKSDIPPLPNHT